MKYNLIFLMLMCLSTSYTQELDTPKHESSLATTQKALSVAVGVGATGSFLFWLAPTIQYTATYGLLAAFTSTYIPRLMIDAGTVALAILAYTNAKQTAAKDRQ